MTHKGNLKKRASKERKTAIADFFSENLGLRLRMGENADRNANILVLVNALVVLFSTCTLILKANGMTTIPIMLLLLSAIATLVPAMHSLQFTLGAPFIDIQDSLDAERPNLVYSGKFQRIFFTEYEASLLRRFEDQQILIGNTIKNEYQQGIVLGKKYLLLRTCYVIFLTGLVLSAISALIIQVNIL